MFSKKKLNYVLVVVFNKSLHEVKLQKKRSFKLTKTVNLIFGECAIVSTNESKLETIQFVALKRFLKKLIKRKKKKDKFKKKQSKFKNSEASSHKVLKLYKIWLNLLPNYVLSKKSKNARMGKGKGNFLRWVFKIQQGSSLVEFLGVPIYRITKLILALKKKWRLNIILYYPFLNKRYFTLWNQRTKSTMFFEKYRYM